jgi:hypothetical protein
MNTWARVVICVLVGLTVEAVVAVGLLWLYLDYLWAQAIR